MREKSVLLMLFVTCSLIFCILDCRIESFVDVGVVGGFAFVCSESFLFVEDAVVVVLELLGVVAYSLPKMRLFLLAVKLLLIGEDGNNWFLSSSCLELLLLLFIDVGELTLGTVATVALLTELLIKLFPTVVTNDVEFGTLHASFKLLFAKLDKTTRLFVFVLLILLLVKAEHAQNKNRNNRGHNQNA